MFQKREWSACRVILRGHMTGGYEEYMRLNDMTVIGDFNKKCFQGNV